MVTGASLVEIDSDVGLKGDIAEGDRPHTDELFEQAKAVRPSQQLEPMRVKRHRTPLNRPLRRPRAKPRVRLRHLGNTTPTSWYRRHLLPIKPIPGWYEQSRWSVDRRDSWPL
jgi:hypothetical protein